MYGGKGEVVGPATERRVRHGASPSVPGEHDPIDCYLTSSAARRPRALPGGYRVGDEVFFTGARRRSRAATPVYGDKGEVVGPATGEKTKAIGLAVQFPGNKSPVNCSSLSRAALSQRRRDERGATAAPG